ncbi:MAG TPA: hypothetical protein VGD81_18105 [Opitutaceae bacterium]
MICLQHPLLRRCLTLLLCALAPALRLTALEGFPNFRFERVAIDPATVTYNPTGEFIFPSVIKAADYFANPLGTYYLYYAPHNNPGGICMAYANTLEGPWTEYNANPLIPNAWPPHYSVAHTSSPHAFWNREAHKLYLYFHGENDITRVASSTDGIHFTYERACLTRADFDNVSEISYARVFEYTIPSKNNKYSMLVMCNYGSNPGRRGIYLAWSDDCLHWTTQRTAVITPTAAEGGQLSGPHFFPWQGKYYVVFHGSSGDMHIAEVGPNFETETRLGVFYDSMIDPPDNSRAAAPAFYTVGETMYMFYEAGRRSGTKIAMAKSALVLPEAPTRLAATARNSVQIDLTWKDQASNELGFKIERASAPKGPFVTVGTTDANASSYSDHGLSGEVTYYYRVRAFNGMGDSDSSNVDKLTTPAGGATLRLYSVAAHDGWVTETAVDSNQGASGSGSSLRTGDSADKQLKAFVSFDTSAIPEGATVISATLRVKKSGSSGSNPFDTLGLCHVDIKGGNGFGDSPALAGADFQADADATQVAQLAAPTVGNGNISTGTLNETGRSHVNPAGFTQLRIYFSTKHDADGGNDYLSWYSGEAATEADRPTLEVSYLN